MGYKYEKKLLDVVNRSLKLFAEHPNLENQYYRVLRIKSKLIGKLLDRKEIFNFKSKLDGLKYSHGLKENYYINPLSDIFRNLISNKCFHLDTLNQFYDKILIKTRKSVKGNPKDFAILIGNRVVFGVIGKECEKDISGIVEKISEEMGGSSGL